jgi:hypothetical protein
VNGRTTENVNGLPEKPLGWKLSERLVLMQVADDLATETPEIVHVVANGFRRETRRGQVLDEPSEVR